LHSAVASSGRCAADISEDQTRHPSETLRQALIPSLSSKHFLLVTNITLPVIIAHHKHRYVSGRRIMKKIWLGATLLAFWAAPVLTQTLQELVNDGKNTENVLTQSMGYDRKSYSPLKQ